MMLCWPLQQLQALAPLTISTESKNEMTFRRGYFFVALLLRHSSSSATGNESLQTPC
jgi:hypothetical protein